MHDFACSVYTLLDVVYAVLGLRVQVNLSLVLLMVWLRVIYFVSEFEGHGHDHQCCPPLNLFNGRFAFNQRTYLSSKNSVHTLKYFAAFILNLNDLSRAVDIYYRILHII